LVNTIDSGSGGLDRAGIIRKLAVPNKIDAAALFPNVGALNFMNTPGKTSIDEALDK